MDLDGRDDRALEALRDRDGVAEVVAVAVRDEDEVAALRLTLALGAARIAGEKRVDVQARALLGVDSESSVAEPRECGSHAFEGSASTRTARTIKRRAQRDGRLGTWHCS